MPGFSLTVLVLPREDSTSFSSSKILELLDAPTEAPGWPWHATVELNLPSQEEEETSSKSANEEHITSKHPSLRGEYMGVDDVIKAELIKYFHVLFVCASAADPRVFLASVRRVAGALITAEPEITRQDTLAGDGDAGLTLKSGAEGELGDN